MAASSPRKAPAKKAAPKKTTEAKVAQFDEYRARAHGVDLPDLPDFRPYEVKGFDPPIVVPKPSLKTQVRVDRFVRAGMQIDALEAIVGSDNFNRILDAFDLFDDGDRLLLGLFYSMSDHFSGKGASEVPGGTSAS
jgi:hypothetical protein